MASYGSSEYGLDFYGTGDPIEYLAWNFQVGWGGGLVDEASLGPILDFQMDRGRDFLLSSSGGWQRFSPGEAVGTFDNSDGRYNYNGILAGIIRPGRRVRITVTVKAPYAETTTAYPVMRGIVDDIQNFFRGEERLTRIIVKDGLEWLARRSATLALVTEEEALITAAAIATAIGFDSFDDWEVDQLGTDSVTVPYAFGNSNSALELINQLVDAEAGQVFHAADGVLTFVTNDYDELETIEIDEEQILRDIEVKAPWDTVRTRAQITANPLVEGSSEIVWTFGNEGEVATWTAEDWPEAPTSPHLLSPYSIPPTFEPLVVTIDADFGKAATSPVVDTEAVLFSHTDAPPATEPWTDVSADPDLDLTTEDIGTGLRLTWEYVGGVENYSQMAVIFADITATPIEEADPITITASNSTAITTYGEKTFELNNPWIQNPAYAQVYADYIVAQLKDPDLYPVIQIEGRGDIQFGFELYVSKVHLTIPTLDIDDTYRVGHISHQWLNRNGYSVRTTLRLEPVLGVLE